MAFPKLRRASVLAAVASLSSCVLGTSATDLGVLNGCRAAIEVDLGDGPSQSFKPLVVQPGEHIDARSAVENPEVVYAFVRMVGDVDLPEPVPVPDSLIDRDSQYEQVEWTITIAGDLCP